MSEARERMEALMEWAGKKYSAEVLTLVRNESPENEGEFWVALRKARASDELKDMRPFSFGRLRCNSE